MVRIGSLFSGIGGLDLGLERAGVGHVAWQVEIDQAARGVLRRHWPSVMAFGDIRSVDWTDVEAIDVLCGGFPCQPASLAGMRKGADDARWLWPEFERAIEALRPSVVVAENVAGLISLHGGREFVEVLSGLHRLGYEVAWGLLAAADLGCCHLRRRLFVVGLPVAPWRGTPIASHSSRALVELRRTLFGASATIAAPSSGVLRSDGTVEALRDSPWGPKCDCPMTLLPTPMARDGKGGRNMTANRSDPDKPVNRGWTLPDVVWAKRFDDYADSIFRWATIFGEAPPEPTVGASGARERLNPDFVRWMMGFPPDWVGGLARTTALRLLGNAVVPQVAERVGDVVVRVLPTHRRVPNVPIPPD